jgi:hypothetical protein
MKLLFKQRDGKKVHCVYDLARTPLRRLFLSGVLPTQKHQELLEIAHTLDPIRLFQQVEQLQQAVFRCAVGCAPVVSSLLSTPICIFYVEHCTAGKLPVEGIVLDPVASLHSLYREQERRKRVLGWRRTQKDPFVGEWEQILSWLVANPERAQWRRLPGAAAPLSRTLSPITNPHSPAGDAQDPRPSSGNL